MQADCIVTNHPESVLRYGRGEQHLYHFNPVLAPQGDIFKDAPWTGIMEDPKRFVVWIYTCIAKRPIPHGEFRPRINPEFSYPQTVLDTSAPCRLERNGSIVATDFWRPGNVQS